MWAENSSWEDWGAAPVKRPGAPLPPHGAGWIFSTTEGLVKLWRVWRFPCLHSSLHSFMDLGRRPRLWARKKGQLIAQREEQPEQNPFPALSRALPQGKGTGPGDTTRAGEVCLCPVLFYREDPELRSCRQTCSALKGTPSPQDETLWGPAERPPTGSCRSSGSQGSIGEPESDMGEKQTI